MDNNWTYEFMQKQMRKKKVKHHQSYIKKDKSLAYDLALRLKNEGTQRTRHLGSQTFEGFNIKKACEENETFEKAYRTWCNIKSRCYNKGDISFRNYGGRGIEMFDEWLNDPLEFILYLLGETDYDMTKTVDRINNNGNYEPGNIRGADMVTQSRNKRNNALLTFNEKTQCIAEWADELGVPYRKMYAWYKKGTLNEKMHMLTD